MREGSGQDNGDLGGDPSSPPPSHEAAELRRERTVVERRSDAELSPKGGQSRARPEVQAVVGDEEEPWPEAEPVRRVDRRRIADESIPNGEVTDRFRSSRAGDGGSFRGALGPYGAAGRDYSGAAAFDRGASGENVDGGSGGVSFERRQENQMRSGGDRERSAGEGWPNAGRCRGHETREGDPPRQPYRLQVSQGGEEGWQAHHARSETSFEFSALERSGDRSGGWKQVNSGRNGDGQRVEGGIVSEDRSGGDRGGDRGGDQDRWREAAGDRREEGQAAVRHAQELREKVCVVPSG